MAELRNCPRCGRIFGFISAPICSFCLEEEEDEFKKVKDYLWDNPGSTVVEVSEATEVEVEKIMRFLREERLQVSSDNPNMLLECERCGRPINMGRFCQGCKDNLQNSFRKEFGLDQKPEIKEEIRPKSEREKMYTASRRKED